MKKNLFLDGILIGVFFLGIVLLLYPKVSNYWNHLHQSQAIVHYNDDASNLSEKEIQRIFEEAEAYNQSLLDKDIPYVMNDLETARYTELLSLSVDGMMGYIEIPSIGCELPIYHGMEEGTLQHAVGHMEWTSLPVGGESTHAVLTGHRGLPSAKLFTNIDKLKIGDVFNLYVLNRTLTYEVDQIRIVVPRNIQDLLIQEGEDLCTLVTCTPYGVNSQRLLVRGHRIDNLTGQGSPRIMAEAIQIDPMMMAIVIAIPLWIIVPIVISRRKK